MTVPATIRAGTTVQWVEPPTVDLDGNAATSASWTLISYLRTNTASEGAAVTGAARADGGWDMAITATTSSAFDAGTWYWETRVTSGATVLTVDSGTTQVLPGLNYTGTPGAFNGQSQAEQDLVAVQAAIRTFISGGAVKQYSIGGRSLTKYELSDLLALESQLKAQVKREQAAQLQANGLGNPHNLFVRF